jgi:hypothetical protein
MNKTVKKSLIFFAKISKNLTNLVILDRAEFSIGFSIGYMEKWKKAMENPVENMENLMVQAL